MSRDAQTLSDAHCLTAADLCRRAGVHRETLWRHVQRGLIPAGLPRPGVRGRFWTTTDANRWLRRTGKADRIFTP